MVNKEKDLSHIDHDGDVRMVDISHKTGTLRRAEASAAVSMAEATMQKLRAREIGKGNVLTTAKLAGIQAAKRTHELIPLCHPLHLTHVDIRFTLKSDKVLIHTEAAASDSTGVEMEALTAASTAALTIYDMLKAVDKGMLIHELKLISKKGGKSDSKKAACPSAAVIVLSDSISAGKSADKSGAILQEALKGIDCKDVSLTVIPDDPDRLLHTVRTFLENGKKLIITSGGTGVGPRDITIETLKPVMTKELKAVSQFFHQYGMQKTRHAMLGNMTAGMINDSLLLSLPGSPGAARDAINALFPDILHVFAMARGEKHG